MDLFHNTTQQLWVLLDVFIACLLAGAVGYEREVHHKPAGFRTHMIVGGSSALLVALAGVSIREYKPEFQEMLDVDPIRIIQAIIIGISFIGAGTILKSRNENDVSFLTTSATILFSSGLGICVALHQYVLAVGVTLLVILINNVFRILKP
ncbi:MgtC/SapB family protein [Porifericola rhodea]|uniref:MgtC/SapB family protein n=1 Tax=Porifericola rhodea TaxID=930972 RepID=UPI002664F44D|nr:MgtC/SapB family protein [Porifericola rhodea]WKN33337.1 MgtC/SapB family protein [Porifericola rhodea]